MGTRTRIPTWAWLVAGGGLIAMTFMRSDSDVTGLSDAEIDALARMLIVEHFGGSDEERAQIVWVALNRAKRWGVSPASVVEPGSRTMVKGLIAGTWNGDAVYRASFERAPTNKNFQKARDFVKDVVAGKYPNRNFTAFIHPGGMKELPPCKPNPNPKKQKVPMDTFAGPRCMPQWAKNPTRIGIAYFYA